MRTNVCERAMGRGAWDGVAALRRVSMRVLGSLLGWLVLWSSAPARAEDAADSRSQAFQAVEGAVQEDIAGGPLLLATYAVIWVVLFLYVFRLVGLQRRTQQELEGLRQSLGSGASAGGTPSGGE